MSAEPDESTTFRFTEDDLIVLLSFMEFCEGGPHRMEPERKKFEYRFRKALDDHFPTWDTEGE